MNDKQFKVLKNKLHDIIVALIDIKKEMAQYRAMMYDVYKKRGEL